MGSVPGRVAVPARDKETSAGSHGGLVPGASVNFPVCNFLGATTRLQESSTDASHTALPCLHPWLTRKPWVQKNETRELNQHCPQKGDGRP